MRYFKTMENGLKMDKDVYEKLYPHQVEGVQWMWNKIHLKSHEHTENVTGGMLSDDMGLGKTIQGMGVHTLSGME